MKPLITGLGPACALSALLLAAGTSRATDPGDLAPHRREWPNRTLRKREFETHAVNFNNGEITGEVTWHVHAVDILDRTVKSATAPEWFIYYPGNAYVARSGKRIAAVSGLRITKYSAPDYHQAAYPPGRGFSPLGQLKFQGHALTAYRLRQGFGAVYTMYYADPDAIWNEPFIYYEITATGIRGSDQEQTFYLQHFLDRLRIRTPGLTHRRPAGRPEVVDPSGAAPSTISP